MNARRKFLSATFSWSGWLSSVEESTKSCQMPRDQILISFSISKSNNCFIVDPFSIQTKNTCGNFPFSSPSVKLILGFAHWWASNWLKTLLCSSNVSISRLSPKPRLKNFDGKTNKVFHEVMRSSREHWSLISQFGKTIICLNQSSCWLKARHYHVKTLKMKLLTMNKKTSSG